MSVVTVAVVSTISIFKLLVGLGVLGASAAGGAALNKIGENRETRENLRHGVLKEAAALEGRVARADDAPTTLKIKTRLAKIRRSAESAAMSEETAKNFFAELNEISVDIRRAETDIKLCRAREQAIFLSLERYVTAGELTPEERAGIEREMAGASRAEAGERLSALSRVSEKLAALKKDKSAPGADALAENLPGPAEHDEIRRDIRDFASRISALDETEGRRAEAMARHADAETKFPDKLEDLRGQLKTLWGTVREREASTSFFRDTLSELKEDLSNAGKSFASPEGQKLLQRCDAMRGAKYIGRTEFMSLYEELAKYAAARGNEISDALFAGKVKEALEELGYEILGGDGAEALVPGEVRYLESPYDGYRVMTKIDEGGALTARLVRVAESGEHARERGAGASDAGTKWCADFDRFLEKMRQAGLPMDVTLRKEPEEAEIMTIADTAESAAGGTRKKRRRSAGRKGESGAGELKAGGESK
ncbi:MAG: hypothetical protein LBL05_05725 [Synergistaceae bacterium]|jgi:hypothetical protein|nr:hypothetical protein [Synergistaceae bacterium]